MPKADIELEYSYRIKTDPVFPEVSDGDLFNKLNISIFVEQKNITRIFVGAEIIITLPAGGNKTDLTEYPQDIHYSLSESLEYGKEMQWMISKDSGADNKFIISFRYDDVQKKTIEERMIKEKKENLNIKIEPQNPFVITFWGCNRESPKFP